MALLVPPDLHPTCTRLSASLPLPMRLSLDPLPPASPLDPKRQSLLQGRSCKLLGRVGVSCMLMALGQTLFPMAG